MHTGILIDLVLLKQRSFVGTMEGELKPMDYESDSEEEISTHEELHNGTDSSGYKK